ALDPAADRVIVETDKGQQTMDQYENEAGQRRCYKRGGADYDAAEDGAEHDDDHIVEGCFLPEGADARHTDHDQRQEKGDDRPADHLETVQVFTMAKEGINEIHKECF